MQILCTNIEIISHEKMHNSNFVLFPANQYCHFIVIEWIRPLHNCHSKILLSLMLNQNMFDHCYAQKKGCIFFFFIYWAIFVQWCTEMLWGFFCYPFIKFDWHIMFFYLVIFPHSYILFIFYCWTVLQHTQPIHPLYMSWASLGIYAPSESFLEIFSFFHFSG